jgi:hypothetical protein
MSTKKKTKKGVKPESCILKPGYKYLKGGRVVKAKGAKKSSSTRKKK